MGSHTKVWVSLRPKLKKRKKTTAAKQVLAGEGPHQDQRNDEGGWSINH